MSTLLALGATFLFTALFAIGGASALIPEFHRQVVDVHRWMDGSAFVHAVALAQVAPGPNVLLVSLIGWQVAGLAGLLVSTLAIIGPPSVLAFAVGRAVHSLRDAPWLIGIKRGLAPVVVGLMLASGLVTARAADHDWLGGALTLVAAVYMLTLRRNPLWIIAAGAGAAMLAYRLGLISV